MTHSQDKALEVIYNSVCPVCEAGICQFKKKVNPEHGRYIWLDINQAPDRLADYNITVDDVRLKLHAIDRTGQLRVGMEAVTAIFSETPGYRWLASLSKLSLLKPLSAVIYNGVAHILYKWNTSKGRW